MDVLFWVMLIGWVGCFFSICSSFSKKGRGVIKLTIPSNFFWGIHYFCLGGISGMIICFLGIIRNISSLYIPFKYSKYIIGCLLLTSICLVCMYAESYYAYITVVAITFISMGVLYPDHDIFVKGTQVVSRILFFIYGFMLGSFPAMFVEVTCLLALLYSIYKHDLTPAYLQSKQFQKI